MYMPDEFYPLKPTSPLGKSIHDVLKGVSPGHGNAELGARLENGKFDSFLIIAHKIDDQWEIGTIVGYDEKKKFHAGVSLLSSW